MKHIIVPTRILFAVLLVMVSAAGYGAPNMEGTYTNNGGMVTLDLKSGGKAIFTMMGESMLCTYKANDDKVLLDCTPKGEKVDFIIHGDGSISGPGFIGNMKKSK
jgi:hypothetical protein